MLVDGRQIASELREVYTGVVSRLTHQPTLLLVIVGDDPVVESFVRIKKRYGEAIGVNIRELRFPLSVGGEELRAHVHSLSRDPLVDGVIVQLPLPSHIETSEVLDAVVPEKDIDMLSKNSVALFARGQSPILPPVAGAVDEILRRYQIGVSGREVLVLGYGRLVGVPVSILLRHMGAHVTVIDKPVSDLGLHVSESAVVVSGVGKPGLILPEMLHVDSVVIDAGTSESGGKIVGDADQGCADVARLITPVPGGVGPIAVAMLFKNLIASSRAHHEQG